MSTEKALSMVVCACNLIAREVETGSCQVSLTSLPSLMAELQVPVRGLVSKAEREKESGEDKKGKEKDQKEKRGKERRKCG